KAQKEIDAVVCTGHLQNFDDKESLSYVSAIVKEVLRWRPVTPIGQCCSFSQLFHISSCMQWVTVLFQPSVHQFLSEMPEKNSFDLRRFLHT
ncbi:hypothetical protein C8J57DRAFT_1087792, partial [Mycena rebaudengoi]